MATTIKLKNGTGVPSAGSLVVGEPALDLTNKRLYTEDSGGTVIEVGTNPTSLTTGTFTSTGIDDNAASTAITIDGSQNVGIGATTVDQHLHVEGAGTQAIKVETTADDYAIMQYKTSTSSLWQSFASPTNDYRIGISGTGDAITINSSLNVGIGNSSPDGLLDIQGNFESSKALVLTNTQGTGKVSYIRSHGGNGESLALYHDGSRRQIWDSSGHIAFENGGTERMRLDSSGNVGIGTGSPSFALDVNHPSDNGLARFTSGDADAYITISDVNSSSAYNRIGVITHDMYFNTNNTERMRIDSSGNVGIGTSSPSSPLHVNGNGKFNNIEFGAYLSPYGDDTYINMLGSGRIQFRTSGSEAMRIDASGNLLVGTTSVPTTNVGGAALSPNDNGRVILKLGTTSTSSLNLAEFFNPNGRVGSISTSASATAYNTSSDYRLKENVVPLTGATERVKQLNPSRFNFIADADTTVDGFLAHEVADVVPEAITGTKDGMRDEEYEVTPAVYEDVVIPAVLDEEGNEVEAERTEQQLVSEAVMGTRSVPDYQGIDQSKLVPLLVATIQELEARITALESN